MVDGRLICRRHDVFLWCYVCFVLVLLCFVFRLHAFVEAAALRSIVLRCAGAPIATRVSFLFFPFVCLEMSLFLFFFHVYIFFLFVSFLFFFFCTISAFSLHGEYVVRSFLLNGVFLPRDHGLDFFRARLGKTNTVKYRGIFRGNW